MQGHPLFLIELVTVVHDGKIEDGPVREFRWLVQDQTAIEHPCAKRLHESNVTASTTGWPATRVRDLRGRTRDGDIVEIMAGVYPRDAAVWRQNNLTIRAVGGRAHLEANGAHAEGKGIWVINSATTTVSSTTPS